MFNQILSDAKAFRNNTLKSVTFLAATLPCFADANSLLFADEKGILNDSGARVEKDLTLENNTFAGRELTETSSPYLETDVNINFNREFIDTLLSFRIEGDALISSRKVELPDGLRKEVKKLISNLDWEVIILDISEIDEKNSTTSDFLKNCRNVGLPILIAKVPPNINANLLFITKHKDNDFSAVLFISPNKRPDITIRNALPAIAEISNDWKVLANSTSTGEFMELFLTMSVLVITLVVVGISIGRNHS
jgi:hypothetical protein